MEIKDSRVSSEVADFTDQGKCNDLLDVVRHARRLVKAYKRADWKLPWTEKYPTVSELADIIDKLRIRIKRDGGWAVTTGICIQQKTVRKKTNLYLAVDPKLA